jgi:hypothetical protein
MIYKWSLKPDINPNLVTNHQHVTIIKSDKSARAHSLNLYIAGIAFLFLPPPNNDIIFLSYLHEHVNWSWYISRFWVRRIRWSI